MIKYLGISTILRYSRSLTTYFGASAIPLGLNLLVNPLIATNMTPRDYAISGYYSSFSSLISPLISFYLVGYYLKEYFRLDEENRNNLYNTVAKALITLSGLISVLCFIGLALYLKVFKTRLEFPVMPYLGLMVFNIPLTGLLSLKLAKCRIERDTKRFFLYSVLSGCLGVVYTLFFVVALRLGALGKLLAPFICNLTIFLYLLCKHMEILIWKVKMSQYKMLFLFCMPLVLGAMMEYFSSGFTNTYLESLGYIDEYGIYIVGASIGGYMMTFSWAIMHTFQPDIYESVTKNDRKRLAKIICTETLIIVLGVTAFEFFAPYILDFLTAGRYTMSAPYARIIAVAAITSVMFYHANDYAIIKGHRHIYPITTLVGGIVIVIAMNVATRYASYVGGAWVYVLSFLIYCAIIWGILAISPKKQIATPAA